MPDVDIKKAAANASRLGPNRDGRGVTANQENAELSRRTYRDVCGKCGAQRVDDQLGLEPTPTLYITRMVEVFREVRRVLRDDGTLWLNIGDSYAAGKTGRDDTDAESLARRAAAYGTGRGAGTINHDPRERPVPPGLKPKDLVGIPWLLALALQNDGWYLRSDIIWAKPNPMPESVTDRPTKAHEYVFLLTKAARYFYDADAVREPHAEPWRGNGEPERGDTQRDPTVNWNARSLGVREYNPAGRNQRSVWQIATQPFPEAHFATYPEELVRRCIQAGTSERGGCAECGAPWRRVTETTYTPLRDAQKNNSEPHVQKSDPRGGMAGRVEGATGAFGGPQSMKYGRAEKTVETTGWEPSCSCLIPNDRAMLPEVRPPDPVPQLVLDPFIGSVTTALVARKHGRRSIGIDLSAEYLNIAAQRTRQLSLLGSHADA